jgi:hypothetical protein
MTSTPSSTRSRSSAANGREEKGRSAMPSTRRCWKTESSPCSSG